MAPRPFDTWPGYIKNSFQSHKDTPITWPAVMEDCIRNGIKEPNFITDVVFYLHVWKDHGWGPAAGNPELEALWKYLNGVIKKRLRMTDADFNREPVKIDRKKWRVRYLQDVDCYELGKDREHRERLSALRLLILKGLEGKSPRHNFDYHTYEWSRIMSTHWASPSERMFNVQNVRRKQRKNALDSFNAMLDRSEVEGASMGNILSAIEGDLYWNTKIFIAWLIAGGGDSNVHGKGIKSEKYNVVEWLEKIIDLGKNPYHVYSIYRKELINALANSKKNKKGVF